MDEMKWYVVHTYSGYENKVKTSIEKAVENVGINDLIGEVVIPEETVVDMKNGVEKIKRRKIFPGYVIVHMIVTDNTWYLVRNTKGVTGFVGTNSNKPMPLSDTEVAKLRLEGGGRDETVRIDLKEGDQIVITDGPFINRSAIISQVLPEKKMIKAQITMFGKDTDIELNFSQIKKMDE